MVRQTLRRRIEFKVSFKKKLNAICKLKKQLFCAFDKNWQKLKSSGKTFGHFNENAKGKHQDFSNLLTEIDKIVSKLSID